MQQRLTIYPNAPLPQLTSPGGFTRLQVSSAAPNTLPPAVPLPRLELQLLSGQRALTIYLQPDATGHYPPSDLLALARLVPPLQQLQFNALRVTESCRAQLPEEGVALMVEWEEVAEV